MTDVLVLNSDYRPLNVTGACEIDRRFPTVDHVQPKSRGGLSSWQNLVAACQRCNGRKGDRRLEDTAMRLRRQPKEPRNIPFLVVRRHTGDDEWEKYLSLYSVSIEPRVRA